MMANFCAMTTMSIRLTVARLLLLMCVGCVPQRLAAPPLLPIGDLLIRETFDSAGMLESFFTDVLNADTVGGVYRVTFTQPDHFTTLRDTHEQANSIIEMTTYVLDGSPTSYYGVGCRLDDQQRGYVFLLSVRGDFSIRRSDGSQLQPLVEWQSANTLVKVGVNARNVLKAACIGDHLSFYVNNEFVADVRDSLYQDGTGGVVIGVGEEGITDIAFDNLQVWASQ